MSSADRLVTLETLAGSEIKATRQAVGQSSVLRSIIDVLNWDETTDEPIQILTVEGRTLAKVMEWCEHHREDQFLNYEDEEDDEYDEYDDDDDDDDDEEKSEEGDKKKKNTTSPLIPTWDARFFDPLDKDMLFKITAAANFLDIPLLLQYSAYVIAMRLKGMNPMQMREFFAR